MTHRNSVLVAAFVSLTCSIAGATDPVPRRIEGFNRDWRFAKGAQPGPTPSTSTTRLASGATAARLGHLRPLRAAGRPAHRQAPVARRGLVSQDVHAAGHRRRQARVSRFRRRDGHADRLCERPAGRRLGLRLHVVPRGRDGLCEGRAAERGGRARGHAPAPLALVSGRGHLPQGPTGRERTGARGAVGDLRHDAGSHAAAATVRVETTLENHTAGRGRAATWKSRCAIQQGRRSRVSGRGSRCRPTASQTCTVAMHARQAAAVGHRVAAALHRRHARVRGRQAGGCDGDAIRHPHVRVHGRRRIPSQRPPRPAARRLPALRSRPAGHGLQPARDGARAADHAGHGRQCDPHQPQPARPRVARPVRPDGHGGVGRGLRQMGRHGHAAQGRLDPRARQEAIHATSSAATATIPCVVVWSVGNEIWDLEGLKYPDSPGLLKTMVGFVKELDTTRPVGLAHCVPESAKSQLPAALDVDRLELRPPLRRSRASAGPTCPSSTRESASAYSTRGYYDDFPHAGQEGRLPGDRPHQFLRPQLGLLLRPGRRRVRADGAGSLRGRRVRLDRIRLPRRAGAVRRRRLGPISTKRKLTKAEESRISSFGIVDLVGIPKDRYYLYRSHWAPEKKTIHILPHWNWPDRVGQALPVYVYTNGDSAELFLNGKSLGKRTKNPNAEVVRDRYALRWLDVVYEPGELKAVAYQDGRELGSAVMRTAGDPASLRLTPDRMALAADGDDLSYVLVEAVDQDGNVCPLAMNDVKFSLDGPATIAGVGNGDHHFPAEFVTDHVTLFYGKAMLIVRAAEGQGGSIRITATSDGMEDASVSVQSLHANQGQAPTP